MGTGTAIAWTDHTFNPWWGCRRVSPGCEHCYAEAWDRRWAQVGTVVRAGGAVIEDALLTHWGPKSPRRFFGDAHWNEPRKWDKAAAKEGRRARVFCASMADVFEDRRDLDDQRERLWKLIAETPNLDWQLLTKRPENIARLMNMWDEGGEPWSNVWLGTTVEDQQRADERIPHLLRTPAAVRFLSCEPLLGPVDVNRVWRNVERWCPRCPARGLGAFGDPCQSCGLAAEDGALHWVIVGGESGPGARQFNLAWGRDLVNQCTAAGVPVFVKQLGAQPLAPRYDKAGYPIGTPGGDVMPPVLLRLNSRKGGDPAEWPGGAAAWPREFPR